MVDERLDEKTLRRILVFRIGHLGDTVVALPAFWTLRHSFPGSELVLLSNSDNRNPNYPSPRNVLPPAGLFDDWITYSASPPSRLALLAKLRRRKFDAVFYLMTRNRSWAQVRRDLAFFRLSGVSEVLCTNYLLTNRLSTDIPIPTPEVAAEADFLLDCLRSEGIAPSISRSHDLCLTEEEKMAAAEFMSAAETRAGFIGIAPGSKWESKIWAEKRFGDVVHRLIGEFQLTPIVLGGPEDREKGERLIYAWRSGLNGAGKLSIRESAAVLAKCRLYLGNDTGVMHLAGAVGTPCVAVFAAVDWIGRWKPFGDRNHIFRTRVECEGCHSPTCHNNRKCLDLITADEVYSACKSILNSVN